MIRRFSRIFFIGGALFQCQQFLQLKPREPGHHRIIEIQRLHLDQNTSTLMIVMRVVRLLFTFLPLVLLYPVTFINQAMRIHYYNFLRLMLEQLGPGFVKLGQWAVTREDLIPKDVRTALSPLHSHTSFHSTKHTIETVKRELGIDDLGEIFDEFDDVPVGSGSIAQVHRARLKATGEEVAVKVCHPNVKERIALDFECLSRIAKSAAPFFPLVDLNEVASQFAENLSRQVDLRLEAQNLNTFIDNFSHMRGVEFPKPHMEYTTPNVLVESFIHGQPSTSFTSDISASSVPHAASQRIQVNCGVEKAETLRRRQQICKLGTEFFMQMIINDNFFHADMHPGNLFVGEYADGKPFVALLDAGITHTLSPGQRANILRFMQAIQLEDPEKCTSCLLNMTAASDKCGQIVDSQKLLGSVQQLFGELLPRESGSSLKRWASKFGFRERKEKGKMTEVFTGLFDVARTNHLQLDATYASLLFSTIMLEGVCNDLDPDFDLVRATVPWLLSSPLQRLLGLEKTRAFGV